MASHDNSRYVLRLSYLLGNSYLGIDNLFDHQFPNNVGHQFPIEFRHMFSGAII